MEKSVSFNVVSLACGIPLYTTAELGKAEREAWAKQLRVVVNELDGPAC